MNRLRRRGFQAEGTANAKVCRLGEALHVQGTAKARVAGAEWRVAVGRTVGKIREVTEIHLL